MTANGQGLLQGWNSLLVRPEPLLIKDIKVQVNKLKPKVVCPARTTAWICNWLMFVCQATLAQNPILCLQFSKFIYKQPNNFRKNKGRNKTLKPDRPVAFTTW
jgi:hypothetical protein